MSRVIVKTLRPRPTPVAQPTPDDGELWRPMGRQEAADWLGVSPTMLSQLTSGGDVPYVLVGATPKYQKADLIDWLRTSRRRLERAA